MNQPGGRPPVSGRTPGRRDVPQRGIMPVILVKLIMMLGWCRCG
jgi:hypothetical protein